MQKISLLRDPISLLNLLDHRYCGGGIKKSSFVVSAIYKDKYGIKINKTLWLYHVLCF